uniref:Photolyase/cryptochrome alpha/beta domain-containing protein n=1 Tax=viral metagenome TaxID=1070528 RepID=A0A6C0H4X7_9ZZZZ
MDKVENGLFIFRRDFRIIDNNGLNFLSNHCDNLFTIFIFTPEQVLNNNYKSNNAIQFMIESLKELSEEIKKKNGHLYLFYGDNNKIIEYVIKEFNIQSIVFNMDITPYSKNRDNKIIQLCKKINISVYLTHDYYLHDIGSIKTKTGQIYQKYTPYYNNASKIKISPPQKQEKINFSFNNKHIKYIISLDDAIKKFTTINQNILVHGGRINALEHLKNKLPNYDNTRNDLTKNTTELSAYIKFGCISIREVYHHFHSNNAIIRQLFWRDFYANILYHFYGNEYKLGNLLKSKYNNIHWINNPSFFKKWCNGQTGFPIVDAGMRQMNITGYMHNRTRLIVASFLVKTLLIDWRFGEKYFANKLTDYDVANNNGNWQWITGGGADSQPFFRIFNPWRQTTDYDPNCEYIKKWIPELIHVPIKDVVKWDIKWSDYKNINYPKPIVDYTEQKKKCLDMYKHALY